MSKRKTCGDCPWSPNTEFGRCVCMIRGKYHNPLFYPSDTRWQYPDDSECHARRAFRVLRDAYYNRFSGMKDDIKEALKYLEEIETARCEEDHSGNIDYLREHLEGMEVGI